MKSKPTASEHKDYLRPSSVFQRFPHNYRPQSIHKLWKSLHLEGVDNYGNVASTESNATFIEEETKKKGTDTSTWSKRLVLPGFVSSDVTINQPDDNTVVVHGVHTVANNENNSLEMRRQVDLPSDILTDQLKIDTSIDGVVTLSCPYKMHRNPICPSSEASVSEEEAALKTGKKGLPYVQHRIQDMLKSIYNGELFSHDIHRQLHDGLTEVSQILASLHKSSYDIRQIGTAKTLPRQEEDGVGPKFQIKFVVTGYTPAEVAIDYVTHGNKLIVEGKHEDLPSEAGSAGSLQHNRCEIDLPDLVESEAISSQMQDKDVLCVEAPLTSPEDILG